MKFIFLIYPLALIMLSCSKKETSYKPQQDDTLSHTKEISVTNTFTGDNLHDNTEELQKFINENKAVHLKAGIYIINKTINLPSGTKLYGEKGTIIKAGNSMSGTLLRNGRYFFIDQADQVVLYQLSFKQSEQDYALEDWNNACIYILNSKKTSVESNTFDFNLPYGTKGMEAVWVSGPGSANTSIRNNTVNTLGIKYAENGADFTTVEINTLINSYSNALTSNGNLNADSNEGCRLINNKIINAGRMGIEDWGKVNGSVIRSNTISGSGKDPNQAIDGIGLSAVGTNVQVLDNIISDTKLYGIEVRGNYGVKVSGNKLNNTASATGIILNYTFPAPVTKVQQAEVTGNVIKNYNIGVHIFGDYPAETLLQYNKFTNTGKSGVSIENGSRIYRIDISNNNFNYTTPALSERFGVFSYSSFPAGSVSQIINLNADTINYATSARAGNGVDMGIVIRTDHAVITNNVINGNNNRSVSGAPVYAITGFGANPVGTSLSGNKISGAIIDLK